MSGGPVILGLDPGFASFGLAAVELVPLVERPMNVSGRERVLGLSVFRTAKDAQKRRTLASDDNVRRAREIAAALEDCIAVYRPAVVAAESMSFPRSSSVAGKMCMAWGVVAAICHRHGRPIVQGSPQQIKMAVCGDKSASKDDIIFALLRRYGNATEDMLAHVPGGQHEHAWDALAAIVAALDSDVVRAVRSTVRT